MKNTYKAEQFHNAFMINNALYYEFNVSKNEMDQEVDFIWINQPFPLMKKFGLSVPCKYSDFIKCCAKLSCNNQGELIQLLSPENIQRRFSGGNKQFSVDYGIMGSDGTIRYFRQTNIMYLDEQGEDLLCCVCAKDITISREREQSYLEKVKRTNSKLNIISALSKTYLAIFDVDLLNDTFVLHRMNGFLRDEVANLALNNHTYSTGIAHYAQKFVSENDYENFVNDMKIEHLIKRMAESPDYTLQYSVKKNSQNQVFFKMHCVELIHTTTEHHVVIGFKCIDEIVRKEIKQKNELQAANALMEKAHQALHSGSSTMNFNNAGEIIYIKFSDELRHMLGYNDTTDFPNTMDSLRKILRPEDQKRIAKVLWGILMDTEKKVETIELEYECYTKKREKRWFKTCSQVDRDKDGMPVSVYGMYLDITTRKLREQAILEASRIDSLTKMMNRRCYEEKLEELRQKGSQLKNVIICAVDVNRLKEINDDIGHEAGDELISGTANVLMDTFGEDVCYRTGGDEFMIILQDEYRSVDTLSKLLQKNLDAWEGKQVKELSVSIGFSDGRDYEKATIKKLLKMAEKRMYDMKAKYYNQSGVDRRLQRDVYDSLCSLYTKILKVDLTNDSYEIIQMNQEEQTRRAGFRAHISSWLSEFARCGYVHPEDLANYLKYTNLEYLKEFFLRGNKSFVITYRRKYGNEYRKVAMEMIIAKDYTEAHQQIYLYVKEIILGE